MPILAMPDTPPSPSAKLLALVERGIEEADQIGMMIVAVKLHEISEQLQPPAVTEKDGR